MAKLLMVVELCDGFKLFATDFARHWGLVVLAGQVGPEVVATGIGASALEAAKRFLTCMDTLVAVQMRRAGKSPVARHAGKPPGEVRRTPDASPHWCQRHLVHGCRRTSLSVQLHAWSGAR